MHLRRRRFQLQRPFSNPANPTYPSLSALAYLWNVRNYERLSRQKDVNGNMRYEEEDMFDVDGDLLRAKTHFVATAGTRSLHNFLVSNAASLVNVPMAFENVMVWKKEGEKRSSWCMDMDDKLESNTSDGATSFVLCSVPKDEWEGRKIEVRLCDARSEATSRESVCTGVIEVQSRCF